MYMKKIIISIFALALLLTSCADNGEYAAKVGNAKISSDEIKFYLSSVKSQMEGTELSNDEDWQTKEIEGRKAIDLAKERALETAVDNLAYIEVGKAIGIKMTSEDKKIPSRIKISLLCRPAVTTDIKRFFPQTDLRTAL